MAERSSILLIGNNGAGKITVGLAFEILQSRQTQPAFQGGEIQAAIHLSRDNFK